MKAVWRKFEQSDVAGRSAGGSIGDKFCNQTSQQFSFSRLITRRDRSIGHAQWASMAGLLVATSLLTGCVTGSSPVVSTLALNNSNTAPNTQTTGSTDSSATTDQNQSQLPVGVPKPRPGSEDATRLALAAPTGETPAQIAAKTLVKPEANEASETKPTEKTTDDATTEQASPKTIAKEEETKSGGFFSRLFAGKKAEPKTKPNLGQSRGLTIGDTKSPAVEKTTAAVKTEKVEKPVKTVAKVEKKAKEQPEPAEVMEKPKKKTGFFANLFSAKPASKTSKTKKRRRPTIVARSRRNRDQGFILPGVRTKLFGMGEDEDIYAAPIRMASVSNMARVGPYGLRVQRPDVQVGCLKPALVRILKKVERRYGCTPVITSGYRSPRHNRRVRGARRSTHMFCKAADIQVLGVSKWQLAKYLRSIPGRGGVGTYCHTKSVHIDVGSVRDWNWRCRRSRGRKKRRRSRKS